MAFSDFEQKRYAKIVETYVQTRRPPVHIRKELDIGFRIVGQSIEIFETRPVWGSPEESVENPIIKATYVKRSDVWRIYWQRADLRWHRYDPDPEVRRLEDVLDLSRVEDAELTSMRDILTQMNFDASFDLGVSTRR